MAVSIDYELGQHGWSNFRLTVNGDSIDVGPFGYCCDALGDLVRAALMIATSGHRAEVSFDGEPVETRLVINKKEWESQPPPVQFHLRLLTFSYFADFQLRLPEQDGIVIFEADIFADAFAEAVRNAAQAIWDQHGAEGYNNAWLPILNGFPLRGLRALTLALATPEAAPRNAS